MSTVTIEIDAKWLKIVRSPLYWIVVALQGVSVTFAPLFLYWSGRGSYFGAFQWIVVPVCFAVILFVPLFYFLLGSAVVSQLRKIPSK